MTSPQFLDYDVALLIARYGKGAVLATLARTLNQPLSEIESLLERLPAGKPTKRRTAPLETKIDAVIAAHPERAERLNEFRIHFENRTWLPELRDVKRLFERYGRGLSGVKSRQEALVKVLKLLIELDVRELPELEQSQPRTGQSSLGIISDEILKRSK